MSFAFGCILIWLAVVVFSSDGNPRKWSQVKEDASSGAAKLARRGSNGPVFLVASVLLLLAGIWLVR